MKTLLSVLALVALPSFASAQDIYIPKTCWKPVMSELSPGTVLYHTRVEDEECIWAINAQFQADDASDRERVRAEIELAEWEDSLDEDECDKDYKLY